MNRSKFRTTIATLLSTFFLGALFAPHALAADAPKLTPVNLADYKPPIRVACLGDSITFGVGAGPGWAYPDQLDRMLGDGWDVRNFGHSGATLGKGDKHSIWGTPQYKEALLFHPDIVIIMLGTNDTKPENWAAKQALPKLYKDLIASFQKLSSKPRVFCCTPPYVGKKGNFGINEANVLEEIPLFQQVAAENGAAVIDVHAGLDKKDELFKDNVHPSAEGATIIAKTVFAGITGNEFADAIPGPTDGRKTKPRLRVIEDPGSLTYREAYSLIVTCGIPGEKLEPVKTKFDATISEVEANIADYENQIAENDSQRMKFKRADPKRAGEFKAKEGQLRKELAKYKRDRLMDLIALVPADFKGAFGAAQVNKYVTDRLAPLASITPEQRKAIVEICTREGPAYGIITNTPERSVEDEKTYQEVYEKVLDAEQKKRVEPR